LSIRLEMLSVAIIILTGALAVSFAQSLTGTLQWTIRLIVTAETMFSSVSRIKDYIDLLEQEAPAIIPENRPPDDWPSQGKIVFNKVCARYKGADKLALDNLSICIDPMEKIGIVGRTGAGKSTISLVLFHLLDIEEGSILIDDLDISKIGLKDLRSRIGIIPQEPILFFDTLRENLDPLEDHSNEELMEVLEKVGLDKKFKDNLDEDILGGASLSVGEKQLVCIARLLLKPTKVLLLDEITANIDPTTDNMIQQILAIHFKSCTVLTIAHRLTTIINSNRIIVMDKGRIVECNTPHALLQNSKSHFTHLVKQTNQDTQEQLRRMAKFVPSSKIE